MVNIYKITNKITKEIYIGQTSNSIEDRFEQHVREAQREMDGKREHFPIFHRSLIKYGVDNFIIELVETCEDSAVAADREIYWIKYYDSYTRGLNSTMHKQIVNSIGRPILQYSLDGIFIREHNSAKEASEYLGFYAGNIRKACNKKGGNYKGFQWKWKETITEQTIEKVDEPLITEEKKRGKNGGIAINQYGKDGVFVHTYNSIMEASYETSIDDRSIRLVLSGKRKTAGGFQWRRDFEEPPNNLTKPSKTTSCPRTQRPVIQYDKNNNEIQYYCSINEAALKNNIRAQLIVNVCEKKQQTAGKFKWEYAKIENLDISTDV